MRRIALFFLVILLSCFLMFMILRDDKDTKVDMHVKGTSFIEGIKIVNKKDGAREWVLYASRADISDSGSEAQLKNIDMSIENKGITIHAEKGRYDMDKKNIVIEGQVTARNKDYTIITDGADFDNQTGQLRTSGDVIIDGKKFHVEGKGLEADKNQEKVRILKDVNATFN